MLLVIHHLSSMLGGWVVGKHSLHKLHNLLVILSEQLVMDVTWSDCHESWNSTDCIIRRFCSHTEYCLHVWSVWHCMRIALSKEISNLCRKEHQKSPLVDPFWVSCRGFLGYSLLYSCQFLSFCHLLSCFCAGKIPKAGPQVCQLICISASLAASYALACCHSIMKQLGFSMGRG